MPLYSDDAEIYLSEVITQISQSDSLRVNTEYNVLSDKVNYPYMMILLGVAGVLGLIGFVFFRKPILKRYKLFLMKRDYEAFIRNFDKQEGSYHMLKSLSSLESILGSWKKYLEKLEKVPYTTLTTKEISKIFDYNQLTSSLQNFDRAIYGGYINEDLTNSIAYLKEIATLRYTKKQKDLENA